ncbi:hypothetical protein TB2_013665 [Malus domestica]
MRYLPVEFVTLTAVEDEYSRAMLSKQPGKGSRQSVPNWRFDFRFRLTALFLLVLQSTLKKWYVVSGKLMLRVKITDKLYLRKSGSRSSESCASSRSLTKLYVVPEELMVHMESGADEAAKAGASSISEIGPRGL